MEKKNAVRKAALYTRQVHVFLDLMRWKAMVIFREERRLGSLGCYRAIYQSRLG